LWPAGRAALSLERVGCGYDLIFKAVSSWKNKQNPVEPGHSGNKTPHYDPMEYPKFTFSYPIYQKV